jgi:hypothetical protein
MANIFTLENVTEFTEKLNLDELYEKKRQHDLNQLSLFNKLLNRIHVRIRLTSRQKLTEQFCWFVVPEVIMGVPKYDQGACIAYLIDRLQENGFNVKYIHPNTLFISWNHFVPSYVRTELKKKTGIVINEYGVKVEELDQNKMITAGLGPGLDPNNLMFKEQPANNANPEKPKKNYTPINSYKPSGNLVYGDDILSSLEEKFS